MTTKQALLKAIEQLPEQQLIEVLHVQHLAHAESTLPSDPIQSAIPLQNSSAQCPGSLAANLDDELYGS